MAINMGSADMRSRLTMSADSNYSSPSGKTGVRQLLTVHNDKSLLPSLFQPTVGALSKGGIQPLFGKEG
jgi:hypothetical protein